jgi:hypothetical protein
MNILKFPFERTIDLQIVNKSNHIVGCELGSSKVEIFQSLCYRDAKDFNKPLVLLFENPLIQSLSMIDYNFNVEQIFVNNVTGLVNKINTIYKKNSSSFIQGYSEFSMVILAPMGFCKKNIIKLFKTQINSIY